MRPWGMAVVVLGAAWFALFGIAHAGTTVRVLETHPPGDHVTLGRNQSFYLRLAYATAQPAGIWVRPYFQGQPVKAGSNPSETHSGSGETFGWFFFMQPGDEVDEIRITAGDGRTGNTTLAATWRGHVVAGSDAVAGAEPAWVVDMRERAKAAQQQAYEARMNAPLGAGDLALFGGFMLAMLGIGLLGFAVPAWGIWRWRGGWRIAAAVPAVMLAFVVLRILVGVARDPTSHNLWPFEILQVGALGVVVMGALSLARKLTGAGRRA